MSLDPESLSMDSESIFMNSDSSATSAESIAIVTESVARAQNDTRFAHRVKNMWVMLSESMAMLSEL